MVDKNLALLVEELRRDGVDKGREEAARLIEEAKRQAADILARAEQDAAEEIARGEREAEAIVRTAHNAAEQAGVSLTAALRQSIDNLLQGALGGILREALEDDALIAQMLTSLAAGLRPGERVQVTVNDAVDLERLTRVVFAATRAELAEGIDIRSAPNLKGIRVGLQGDSVQYELSETLLVEVISPFLSERARSLLFP